MNYLPQGLQAPLRFDWTNDAILTSTSTTIVSNASVYDTFMMFVRRRFQALVAFLGLLCASSSAQDNCTASIASTAPPAPGTGVQLQQFSYCGGNLNVTAYIEVSSWNNDASCFLSSTTLGHFLLVKSGSDMNKISDNHSGCQLRQNRHGIL